VTAMDDECEVIAPDGTPAGLLEAFWSYDRALLGNDTRTLDELFMPGPHTLRGDGLGLLVGHQAIAAFRSARARIATRRVAQLHVQVIADDAALLMARTRDGDATGLQTAKGESTTISTSAITLASRSATSRSISKTRWTERKLSQLLAE